MPTTAVSFCHHWTQPMTALSPCCPSRVLRTSTWSASCTVEPTWQASSWSTSATPWSSNWCSAGTSWIRGSTQARTPRPRYATIRSAMQHAYLSVRGSLLRAPRGGFSDSGKLMLSLNQIQSSYKPKTKSIFFRQKSWNKPTLESQICAFRSVSKSVIWFSDCSEINWNQQLPRGWEMYLKLMACVWRIV